MTRKQALPEDYSKATTPARALLIAVLNALIEEAE